MARSPGEFMSAFKAVTFDLSNTLISEGEGGGVAGARFTGVFDDRDELPDADFVVHDLASVIDLVR